MDKTKLQEILDKHLKWLHGETDGERANLRGANLSDAKGIEKAFNLFCPIACPSDGAFISWKKARYGKMECIVKLRITEDARRSSATGRKCRCDKAEVLEVQTIEGERIDGGARSGKDEFFLYKTGEIVSVPDFAKTAGKSAPRGSIFTSPARKP